VTRVCIIGNSHLAAWKLGWDRLREGAKDFDVTFFGSPRNTMHALSVQEGRLVPTLPELQNSLVFTSGGTGEIVAADYDLFCLVGLGYGARWIVDLHRDHRAESHGCRVGTFTLVSDACFEAAIRGTFSDMLALQTYRKLREITAAPVVLAPHPLPSLDIMSSEDPQEPHWRVVAEAGDDRSVVELMDRVNRGWQGLRILPQPADTLAQPLFTQPRFSLGSVRLSQGFQHKHPESDHFHMNADYGAICMEALMAAVKQP
jgi:hypothetical protein